jgi:hypothetical protein
MEKTTSSKAQEADNVARTGPRANARRLMVLEHKEKEIKSLAQDRGLAPGG